MRKIFLILSFIGSLTAYGTAYFSVSDSTTVELAPSNLQYQPSTGTYRLAEHAPDIIGEANSSFDDSTYGGWLDLLVWGDYTYDTLGRFLR